MGWAKTRGYTQVASAPGRWSDVREYRLREEGMKREIQGEKSA